MDAPAVLLAIFFFALGSCIGSFLNVVIWRLPYIMDGLEVTFQETKARLSLSWPPSHCPNCDTAIPWYLNIPVLGWLMIAGRCAKCRAPVALRYPMVELSTGMLFAGTFLIYYVGQIRGPIATPYDWAALVLHLLFIACLLAAAAVDADSYMIPPQIAILLAGVAVVASPFLASRLIPQIAVDGNTWQVIAKVTLGGAAGLLLANVLVRLKILPLSFPGPASEVPAKAKIEPVRPLPNVSRKASLVLATIILLTAAAAAWLTLTPRAAALVTIGAAILIFLIGVLARDHDTHDATDEVMAEITAPGARREILKEILFLLFPVAGALLATGVPLEIPQPAWLARLVTVLLGLLVGGGSIWLIRVLGTLWKGIEAMGLGDVHLMAAAGAVLGPLPVLTAFPIFAPILGLGWALFRYLSRRHTILPFGPWLAIASIVALFVGEPVIGWYLARLRGP